MNSKHFLFKSEAPKFEPVLLPEMHQNYELPTKSSFVFKDEDWKLEEVVEYMGPRPHEITFQYLNPEPEIVSAYEIGYTRKSDFRIKGEDTIAQNGEVLYNYRFNDDGIQDFDSILVKDNEAYRPMALLGTYSLTPSPSAKGIAAGTIIMDVDTQTKHQSRQVEYTLNDEAFLIVVTANNDGNETVRLRISNSFTFAENFDFGVKNLIEVAVLAQDIYKIEIVIKPSGAVTHNCRLLR